MDTATITSGHKDFDFLFGRWKIRNRRLKERLVQCDSWEEFEANCEARPILHGYGNIDRYMAIRNGKEFEGMTLRLFNPSTQLWSIYWADSIRVNLEPPVVGAFKNDTGLFFGDDTHEGIPVIVRFTWTHTGSASARWEQAFSTDRGVSWETNWIMEFERV